MYTLRCASSIFPLHLSAQLRLGKAGYRAILEASMENAAYLRQRLVETGKFAIHDKAHMPLVAFSLKDPNTKYRHACRVWVHVCVLGKRGHASLHW